MVICLKRMVLVFLIQWISLSATVSMASGSSAVRIRLFKDLVAIPQVARAKVKVLSPSVYFIEGNQLQYQGVRIANKNYLIKKKNKKYDLIAVVDFNTYLAGVVSKEMPLGWPIEALKAQAVVARSYALSKIQERSNQIFHLDTDQMDQVFAFTDSEKAKQAVLETDQVILKDQKNKILKAFYHSDCGGHTVPASAVWNGAIDSGTASDPWCLQRSSNAWSYSVDKESLKQKLQIQSDFQIFSLSRFKDKIQSFQMMDQVFSVQKLRQLFGYANVRNSPVEVTEGSGQITFKGKGFGHGAGLCQWGTRAQALLGFNYTQVLQHYYPKAILTMNSNFKISKIISTDHILKHDL